MNLCRVDTIRQEQAFERCLIKICDGLNCLVLSHDFSPENQFESCRFCTSLAGFEPVCVYVLCGCSHFRRLTKSIRPLAGPAHQIL
jgi:hypothetical protein